MVYPLWKHRVVEIDNDLPSSRKADGIQILKEVYGEENIAQICTFQNMKAKAVIDAVGRVLGLSVPQREHIKKYIYGDDLEESLKKEHTLRRLEKQYPKLFSYALKLQGLPKSMSIHAGGVVVVPDDKEMYDFTALALGRNKEIITQLDMKDIEKVGLVKIDILATAVLDIIDNCLELVGGQDK